MADTTHFFMIESVAKGLAGAPTTGIVLANGLNSNIASPATGRLRITGPTGAFSFGSIQGGVDGRQLRIYNAVAQTMTIVNEDSSATSATFRITTLTGGNVVLRTTAKSFFTLSYDGTDSRWILESTN